MLNFFPKIEIILVFPKSSVAMKKGNNAGITLFAHNANPFFAAVKLEVEKNTKQIVNSTNKIVKKFSFREKTKNFTGLIIEDFLFNDRRYIESKAETIEGAKELLDFIESELQEFS